MKRMTIREFFTIEMNDLAIMVGMGFFLGSMVACILALFMSKQEAHWWEIGAAFIGFICGRFMSDAIWRKRAV